MHRYTQGFSAPICLLMIGMTSPKISVLNNECVG